MDSTCSHYPPFVSLPVTTCEGQSYTSLAAATDQLALHRFQLAIVIAIAEVFAVLGTNFIYSNDGQLIAVGVGWLLTAIVDVRTTVILYRVTADSSSYGSYTSPVRKVRRSINY